MQGGMKKLTIFDQFIASNSLSIHTKFSAGETKMWATVRENGDFLTVVNYTFFAAIIDSFMSN